MEVVLVCYNQVTVKGPTESEKGETSTVGIYLSVGLCLSVCLSVSVSHVCLCLTVSGLCLTVCLSLSLSVCVSVCLCPPPSHPPPLSLSLSLCRGGGGEVGGVIAFSVKHKTLDFVTLCHLRPVTEDFVRRTILSSPLNTREFDAFPTPMLLECLDSLLPCITAVFNNSLVSGVFPICLQVCSS